MKRLASLTIKHNFETAHRLPFIAGKCMNIHGHSWNVTLHVEGVVDENGIVAEYGQLKNIIRRWIDKNLDHGAMLGWEDPLRDEFLEDGTKVFWFGKRKQGDTLNGTHLFPWPTVEAVAAMLGEEIGELIYNYFPNKGIGVRTVELQETSVNGVVITAS